MAWNTLNQKIRVPLLPVPSGHERLSEILLYARKEGPPGGRSHLSDAALKRLVELAYYGSQQTEEGRYPTCRFFSYPDANRDDLLFTMAVFNPPIELDLESLRRLAHIAPRHGHALVIAEDGDRLVVTRLMSLDSLRDFNRKLGRPEYWTSLHRPMGLMITIDGPGALQVSENDFSLKLRAGRIEESIPFFYVPGVNEWSRNVATNLHKRVVEKVPTAKGYFGDNMFMLVNTVWSQVLSGCVSERHGGVFVIIDPESIDGHVHFKYPMQLDLGDAIIKFWLECIEGIDGKENRELELWLRRRNQFLKQIDGVSSLANVDGCVCLTPDLKVLGFGGEILVDETTANESSLVLVDAKGRAAQDCQGSSQFGGTRHRSAFRLCKKVSNTKAFVISQDGDLRVFYSDDKNVFAFKSLGAWIRDAQLG